ncbi:MAG TPA: lantibiotic dehydratase, partial [Pyrinomonadaceae bacterium]|nr:lantibiotic dehydratase [Pyrinomonadaceae bacterium]
MDCDVPQKTEVGGSRIAQGANDSTGCNPANSPENASSIELFEHGVLRCANWAIETLEPFGSAELASLAVELQSLAESIKASQKPLSSRLYVEIPRVNSLSARRALLRIRRAIRSSLDPYDADSDGIRLVSAELRKSIESDLEKRRRYVEITATFSRIYEQEVERERSALHRLTENVAFQRALVLANPELAKRWRKQLENARRSSPGEEPLSKEKKSKIIKTEGSILSYLFRAATRPTPGGLWAGVAPIYLDREKQPERDLQIVPVKSRFLTTVNLAAFERVVDQLRKQPRYRTFPMIRLAPTVHRDGATWWYQTRKQTKHEWSKVPDVPCGPQILEFFADGRPYEADLVAHELARQTVDQVELTYQLLSGSISRLVDEEVLVSTLAMSNAAENWLEALHDVARQLTKRDRDFWLSSVQVIQSLCEQFSERLSALSPDDVDRLTTAITQEMQKLYEWVGLTEPLPKPLVLVDTKLGFEVRCNTSFWDTLANAVRELLAFYQSHDVAEQLRRVTLETLLGQNEAGVHRSFLEMVRTSATALELSGAEADHKGTRELKARLQKEVLGRQYYWYEQLMSNKTFDNVTAPATMCNGELRAGFDGTVLLNVLGTSRIRAEWGRPHALCLVSRLSQLLKNDSGEFGLTQAVSDWYRSWTLNGFEPIEIAGSDSENHNATTRPRMTVDRVLADGSETRMSDLCVESTAGVIRPWLRHTVSNKTLIPVYNCVGVIGMSDASSQSLYRLALSHGWEFVCRRLFPGWLQERLPRLSLGGDTVVSPRRWFLTAAKVESLLQLNEVERYAKWITIAKDLEMPARVMVVLEPTPDVTLLYLPVTSPLAVRSLFA